MKYLKKMWGFVLEFIAFIKYRAAKKHKRLYVVYNSDAAVHIGLQLRGLPKEGAKVIIKGGTIDTIARHFEIQVLTIFELTKIQKRAKGIANSVDAYYIDGRYNDLEIKRI